MKKSFTIAVFEGDGIGPEIMAPTLDILELLQNDTSKYDDMSGCLVVIVECVDLAAQNGTTQNT